MFQGYLTSYSEYTTKEMAKMGRYGTKNGPAKAARHFSQLLHCNSAMRLTLYCSSNIILWLRDQIAKFYNIHVKFTDFKSAVLGEITKIILAKFPRCTVLHLWRSLAMVRLTLYQICPTNDHGVQCVKLTVVMSPLATKNCPPATYFELPGAILGD